MKRTVASPWLGWGGALHEHVRLCVVWHLCAGQASPQVQLPTAPWDEATEEPCGLVARACRSLWLGPLAQDWAFPSRPWTG